MFYPNQQQKPICIAVIVINVKIMLRHSIYISGPYTDTAAGKTDWLPYSIIENSSCYSKYILVLFPYFLFPSVCQNQIVNHVTLCEQFRPAVACLSS
jgi:hypothetical protein